MTMMCMTATVAAEAEDAAAGVLMTEGIAFELRDATTLLKSQGETVELVLTVAKGEAEPLRQRVDALLREAEVQAVWRAAPLDEGWRDGWKAYFQPRPIGPFVLVPSWERYTPAAGETVIDLDPGRAFGTGGHASTRLCLRALGEMARCDRFLDVGTGSGVLAIACARRFPGASGWAIDIDPEAVEVTLENAERNGVMARIATSTTPLEAVPGTFDVVVANLTGDTLITLRVLLAAHLAPGGRLVASGVLVVEAERVAAALGEAGLALVATEDEDEWRGLVFEHAAG